MNVVCPPSSNPSRNLENSRANPLASLLNGSSDGVERWFPFRLALALASADAELVGPYGLASYGGGQAANRFGTAVDLSNQGIGRYDDLNDDDEYKEVVDAFKPDSANSSSSSLSTRQEESQRGV
jgi:hypothetical protein